MFVEKTSTTNHIPSLLYILKIVHNKPHTFITLYFKDCIKYTSQVEDLTSQALVVIVTDCIGRYYCHTITSIVEGSNYSNFCCVLLSFNQCDITSNEKYMRMFYCMK